MPYYKCTIINAAGKKSTVIKEALDEHDAAASFNGTDQTLIKYKQIEDSAINLSKKNYNRDVILEFTEIMSSLLKAGLTVQDSVSLCASVASDPKTILLCKSIHRALQSGLPLHEVLKTHSPSFSSLYQSLVRLGEKTGSVASVFKRMSSFLRNEKKIRGKIGNVILYPSLVLFAALTGSAVIIIFLMPKMMDVYTAFRPDSTEEAIKELNSLYLSVWSAVIFFIFIASAVITAVFLYKKSQRFSYLMDYAFLRMPIFGNFFKAMQTMDFSFAMEMLSAAGINIHNALGETAAVAKNRAYSKAIRQVYQMLSKGERLSCAFASFKEFPPYIPTWIAVGERTGDVASVFTQIRDYYQEDVERMTDKLMGLLEPCLILVVGIIVIILILQFVLPLFSLYGRLI